jgi:hypothetical protein
MKTTERSWFRNVTIRSFVARASCGGERGIVTIQDTPHCSQPEAATTNIAPRARQCLCVENGLHSTYREDQLAPHHATIEVQTDFPHLGEAIHRD